MAAKKRKRKKPEKTYPVLAFILIFLLLVVVPLCLMKLKDLQKSQEQPQTQPTTTTQSKQNQNPYRKEDFVMENGFMTCLTTEGVPGIDVSSYQGEIDWQQVREAGIEFAFIRVGYRRSKDGTLGEDPMAKINLQGASEAGMKVGAYFFSQATSVEEAKEEAQLALEILQDFPLDLPLVYDWETVSGSERTDGMTQQLFMECLETFCGIAEKEGYETMVYFNRELARSLLDVTQLKGRQVWFAMYGNYPDAPCKPDYWQYSDKGKIPGIEGDVDLNIYLP